MIREWIDTLFGRCTLCGRCTINCSMGINITALIRAARTALSSIGLVPPGLQSTVDTAVETGNNMGISRTEWVETVESGPVIGGEPGTGNFGLIESGALETSNVDLTAELVNLITAQRNFQANSKAIETANTITQTIINIR